MKFAIFWLLLVGLLSLQTLADDAYDVPNLKLKTDPTYAETPEDVEPFGGVKPYKRHFLQQMEYTGPGRAIPEPKDLKSVKIGFIGPIQPTVSVATGGKSHEEPMGTKMLQGARLALEQANERGGYRKKIPYELVVSNDNGLWGASGNEIIKLAYKDKVWGILGTIDGANSHIAIRVALKAEILMMNTGDTDPTFIETNIPWVMRCIGDDRQQSYLLVDYMIRKMDYKRIGIIRSSNRFGRFGVREVRDSARRLGRPIILEMAYRVGSDDFVLQIERLKAANLDAVVHWGDARESAMILNQMRKTGMTQPYLTNDRSVTEEFVKIAGANAEGVIAAYPWNPNRKAANLDAFRMAFKKRFSEEAETYAAHAYDGMNLLIWAIEEAGLNRAKIRDLLAYRTTPWPGVTGDIVFSAALDDVAEVAIAENSGGVWTFHSRDDLKIPRGFIPRRDRTTGSAPYKAAEEQAAVELGPGGDETEAAVPDEIRIGYFGPSSGTDPKGGMAWHGTELAVTEANREGGYKGRSFRLLPGSSENPWSGGVQAVTRMVFKDQVWALLGPIDGTSAHLAEQVVAKARVPLLDSGSTDSTVNMAHVPWAKSLLPGDRAIARAMVEDLLRENAAKSFALISATDHDSRSLTAELRKVFDQKNIRPKKQVEFKIGEISKARLAKEIADEEVSAVLVIADAVDSAQLISALKQAKKPLLLYGGPSIGRTQFKNVGGAAGEEVRYPVLTDPSSSFETFSAAFTAAYGLSPDYSAASAYDAARLLVAAIRSGGLNRVRILKSIERLSPWSGVTGKITFDTAGRNDRGVRVVSLKENKS